MADRLALLTAIDGFFKLLADLPGSEDTIRLGFTIRRCEYAGRPADMKTLESLLGWTKGKLCAHFNELEETFGFWRDTDPRDARRSIARIPPIEDAAATAFYDKYLAVVDQLELDRQRVRTTSPSTLDIMARLREAMGRTARVACLIPTLSVGLLGGWLAVGAGDRLQDQQRAALIVDEDDDDDEALVETFAGEDRIVFAKSPKRVLRSSVRLPRQHVRTNPLEHHLRAADHPPTLKLPR